MACQANNNRYCKVPIKSKFVFGCRYKNALFKGRPR